MNKQIEAIPFAAALGAAAVGLFVYLLDRSPDSVYFIPEWISITNNLYPVFGQMGYHLPTFIHVYVFTLLTFVVTSPSAVRVYPICIGWFAVDSLFELAQLTPVAQWIAEYVPVWFTGIPFLENTATYFLAGTFDYLDLISIAMGTVAAYLTIQWNHREGKHNAHEK